MNSKQAMDLVYSKYWADYPSYLNHANALRHSFNLDLVVNGLRQDRPVTVCDIGGGWGAFSAGAAVLGMNAILVDDSADNGFYDKNDARHGMAEDFGFKRVCREVVKNGLDFEPGSIDVFTSFDSMEQWHNSPKKLFGQVSSLLRPGGMFILGVPNAVNLRKRIQTPLGKNKWSSMDDWYETPEFRGHVREPDVDDLRYIAKDMGLRKIEIIGRNWQGYLNMNKTLRLLSSMLDLGIRMAPSLCSDIYMVGFKQE